MTSRRQFQRKRTANKPMFPAKWDGRCGACDDKIYAGDLVKYIDDELCHAQHGEEEY